MDTSSSTGRGQVAASFENRSAADEAIADLLTAGFQQDQIRLALAGGGSGAAEGEKTDPSEPAAVVPGLLVPGGTYGNIGGGYPVSLHTLPAGIVTLNLTNEDVEFFTGRMGAGHALVVVDAGPRAEIAKVVLERNGGTTRPAT